MSQHMVAALDGIQIWKQDGQPLPEWLQAWVIGRVEPNGTFLIRSSIGQQRVHHGDLVVEHGGDIHVWSADEAGERLAELREQIAVAGRPLNLVGPGKSLKTAIPSRRRSAMKRAPEKVRTYPPVRGVPSSIEWIAVEGLMIDSEYQRSIDNHSSRRLIASIAAHWDWRLCMPLAVSRRGDERYVIDGQHRLEAARLRGDLLHLPCSVATYDGPGRRGGHVCRCEQSAPRHQPTR